MPPGFTSARFVGREWAFVRLAPVLQAATDGLSVTVLVDGPGGIGSSPLLTEASPRPTGLTPPFTVLRGPSPPPLTHSPYRPALPALRPAPRALHEPHLS